MIFNSTPDGFIEALDARTGELRWETKSSGRLTAGVIVVEGQGADRAARARRAARTATSSAHDAKTGKEVWRFYTAAASNEPGGETWGGAPDETRAASTWALPGGYDPVRRLVYWGVANPTPNTRANRHGGNSNAIPDRVAGRSVQQLDDRARSGHRQAALVLPAPARRRLGRGLPERAHAAADGVQSRSEVREVDQPRRQARRAARRRGDGRRGRRHLRASIAAPVSSSGRNPFPFDTPDFLISNIDGKTGRVSLNKNKLFTGPSDRRVICYWNTRSYWPTAYHPGRQLAVRAVRRELPRHDVGRAERRAARAARRHSAAGLRSRTRGRA